MKLIKIGAKVVRHSRYVIFQMSEVAVSKALFCEIPGRIRGLAMAGDAFRSWLMLKIAKKLGFQAGTMVEVRQKAGNQPPIRIFSIIVAEISSR